MSLVNVNTSSDLRRQFLDRRKRGNMLHGMPRLAPLPQRKATPVDGLRICKRGHPMTPENTRIAQGYASCVACYRATSRTWMREHRTYESNRIEVQARLTWLRAGDVTPDELRGIALSHGFSCAYCSRQVDSLRFWPSDPRGFDHVVPRIAGGRNTAENIVLCCSRCNARKGARSVR